MQTIAFTATEHDALKPWLVLGVEHQAVELEDGHEFFARAAREWPAPRWSVQLDPRQLSPRTRNRA